MTRIDYSTDVPKHYVRRNGWLSACQQQARTVKKRSKKIPLRYFTFCAADAIDVFMLEREGILKRSSETGRLEGVFFCEADEDAFGKIADLIGSPEQGFLGQFEKIVLFKDDRDTEGRDLYGQEDEYYPEDVRKKLRYKDAHKRFKAEFPFDIINLDVFGIMFPPRRAVIAPLVESLIEILKWQTGSAFPNGKLCKQFTLFLTSHIDHTKTDQEAIRQLTNRVAENIDSNVNFRSAFLESYGHQEATRLARENFAEFFCLALPKFLIHLALFDLGWDVNYGPSYLYNREDIYVKGQYYQIMHSISAYIRVPDFRHRLDAPGTGMYTRAVTQLINDGVIWIDETVENPEISRELQTDLTSIVEFREQYRAR